MNPNDIFSALSRGCKHDFHDGSRCRCCRSQILGCLVDALVDESLIPDERYFHNDLTELPIDSLVAERTRLRIAKAIALLSRWATERLDRIEAELVARRACGPRRTAAGASRLRRSTRRSTRRSMRRQTGGFR